MNLFGARHDALANYLFEIKSFIDSYDGNKIAHYISIEKFIPSTELYHTIINLTHFENLLNKILDSPWNEVIKFHLLSYQSLIKSFDYSAAFGFKCSIAQSLVKIVTQIKEENWMLPIIYATSVELRKLAILADNSLSSDSGKNNSKRTIKPNANIEEAASHLMNFFRVCANDSRTTIEVSKRKGMMNIINQLFKIYFRINKLNLYKPLVRALENANIMEHFTLAEKVTYSYFTGMKSLYDSSYSRADDLLKFSFENCNPYYQKNRRIILIFYIPVKMLFSGFMPTKAFLEEYDLLQFNPLCEAIKEGNLYLFDASIEQNAEFFYYYGIYFTLEKLKTIVYRNIFKKVSKIINTHQIPLNHFVYAINYFQSNRGQIDLPEDEKVTCEEVHCLLANLIAENKLKGYISLQHQKLVISKQNPFPKLSSISA